MKNYHFRRRPFRSGAIRHTTLYRGRKPAVALVHGLFATEGYWLPYLKILQHYRLVLIGVDYACDDFDVDRVAQALNKICRHEGVQFIVGHSLGASLVRLADKFFFKALICDVTRAYIGERNSLYEFGANRRGITDGVAEASLKNAKYLRDLADKQASDCDLLFVPSRDQYFQYSDASNFDGDHFDIENALLSFVEATSEAGL